MTSLLNKAKSWGLGSRVSSVRANSVTSDDRAKLLLGGETFMRLETYSAFWTTLFTDRNACSRFVARIVNLLMNLELDYAKATKEISKNSSIDVDYFVSILLNTIKFLDMFAGFDISDPAFVASLEKYEVAKRMLPRFRFKRIEESVGDFARRRQSRGQLAVKLIVDCSSLESEEEVIRAMKKSTSMLMFLDESDQENIVDMTKIDYPFTFFCLCKMVRSNSTVQIFDEILRQLGGAAACVVSALPHMQGRTLAILLMLRELLIQNPTSDDSWMQRASNIISAFYKWPKPYGLFARQMIEFITIERRSPGWHLRRRLMNECPQLRPAASVESTNSSRRGAMPAASGRTFVFFDGTSDVAKAQQALFKMKPWKDASENTDVEESRAALLSLKKRILMHTLEVDFDVRQGDVDNEDSLNLNSASEADVGKWYEAALEITRKAASLPCEEIKGPLGGDDIRTRYSLSKLSGGIAKLYREAHLSKLLASIVPGKTFAVRRSVVVEMKPSRRGSVRVTIPSGASGTPSLPRTISRNESEESSRGNTVRGEDTEEGILPPAAPLQFGQFSPELPELSYCFLEVSPESFISTSSKRLSSHPGRQIKYLADSSDLSALSEIVDLARAANQSKSNSVESPDKVEIRIVLIGGNVVVNRFLCAYVSWCHSNKTAAMEIDWNVYVVPSERNDLATFLAHSDKWYRRHVFFPFVGPLALCPQFAFGADCGVTSDGVLNKDTAEGIVAAAAESTPLPVICQRWLLEGFVRQASQVLNVCIFECLCWSDRSGSELIGTGGMNSIEPNMCIPFVSHLDIGVFTQAEMYRRQTADSTDAEHIQLAGVDAPPVPLFATPPKITKEIFNSRQFSPSAIELNVSYAPSTMTGDVMEDYITKTDQFISLSLNNLPEMYDDFGTPITRNNEYAVPNSPNCNWLVMDTRTSKIGIREHLANRKKLVKGKPDPFVDALYDPEAFDIPANVSVVDITAVNPLESFHVLIDGRLFGPFKRVVIQPSQRNDPAGEGKQRTLPIKAFMPVAE